MESIKEIFRIGTGPSSSHTMAPRRAATRFKEKHPGAVQYRVSLFSSLAATGVGHMTDKAIEEALAPHPVELLFKPDQSMPDHPNGMLFEAFDAADNLLGELRIYSVGGGALQVEGHPRETIQLYQLTTMKDILAWAEENGQPIWTLVKECEDESIWEYLREVWQTMQQSVERGLKAEGVLPGGLRVPRKARSFYLKARRNDAVFQRTGLLSAYALAVAEENASGGIVVTAPTCGSSGVLPAVLRFLHETLTASDEEMVKALATAGLVGNLVKFNASISGAAVGCQGEVGTACAMAAAAASQLMGGTGRQIEYAAEMGLEHHLGLTCDPVAGLVQIPCIERNAVGATRAVDCADFTVLTDGSHRITFDNVVSTMNQTGKDMNSLYRETSLGGLAGLYRLPH